TYSLLQLHEHAPLVGIEQLALLDVFGLRLETQSFRACIPLHWLAGVWVVKARVRFRDECSDAAGIDVRREHFRLERHEPAVGTRIVQPKPSITFLALVR